MRPARRLRFVRNRPADGWKRCLRQDTAASRQFFLHDGRIIVFSVPLMAGERLVKSRLSLEGSVPIYRASDDGCLLS